MLRVYIIKPTPDPRTLPGYYSCLAVVPFRQKSLAVVPFARLKVNSGIDFEQMILATELLLIAIHKMVSTMERTHEAMDEFAFRNIYTTLDEKRNRRLRWYWFRLLQILGIY